MLSVKFVYYFALIIEKKNYYYYKILFVYGSVMFLYSDTL